MKLSRLENDTNWNYGISFKRAYDRLDAYNLDIWLFKQKELPLPYEVCRVDKGFRFTMQFGMSDRCYVLRLPRIRTRIV